jgi:hypothetical protein
VVHNALTRMLQAAGLTNTSTFRALRNALQSANITDPNLVFFDFVFIGTFAVSALPASLAVANHILRCCHCCVAGNASLTETDIGKKWTQWLWATRSGCDTACCILSAAVCT